MPSWAIIGASRGIGYGWLTALSTDPSNTIIGTARNPSPTASQVQSDNLKNVHILQADLISPSSLQAAAAETAKLTNNSLDYLIINGAYMDPSTSETFLNDFPSDDKLKSDLRNHFETNAIGVINALNAFLPLVLKSSIKKILVLSTGMADVDLVTNYEIWEGASYAISKAATNMIVAKYHARYKKDGLLVLSISPGVVNTGGKIPESSELPMKFGKYAPHFTGPITPAESVKAMKEVFDRATVEEFGGGFVSHTGTKEWL